MILKVFKNKTKILFLHIPKTGGTSLKVAFLKKFEHTEIQRIYGFENFKSGVREFASNKKKVAVGHFGWEPEMKQLFKKAFKITFLRHPVARVISHYWHFQRSTYQGDDYLKGMSFEDFLETPFAQNWQTKRLGGGLYDTTLAEEACFSEALKNVESRFEFIGITERMMESTNLLSRKLSMEIPEVKKENVNPQKSRDEEMARKYGLAILEKNKWDMKLYQAGLERLEKEQL